MMDNIRIMHVPPILVQPLRMNKGGRSPSGAALQYRFRPRQPELHEPILSLSATVDPAGPM